MKRRLLMAGGWATVTPWTALAAEPAAAPARAVTSPLTEPLSWGSAGEMAMSLLLVVAAILVVAWMARRVGGLTMPAGGQMRVLGGLAVGPRERVVLVQVGDTQLVLGVAPGRVEKLHVLERPVELQPLEFKPFAERLAEKIRRGKES